MLSFFAVAIVGIRKPYIYVGNADCYAPKYQTAFQLFFVLYTVASLLACITLELLAFRQIFVVYFINFIYKYTSYCLIIIL